MGVIRLLLAISVVLAHANSKQLVGGSLAVQAFFVISGFYMALVLNQTYASVRVFYLNRFLRLYPAYFVIAVITAVVYSITGGSFYGATWNDFQSLDWASKFFLAVTNLGLVFQDWTLFLGTNDGALSFVRNFRASDYALYRLLLVPQAWSLGIEITFYALAPFLVRLRWGWLAGLLVVSMSARFLAYNAGLDFDPWTYRFFPFELALFIVGILGYRGFAKYISKDFVPSWSPAVMFVIAIVSMVVYRYAPAAPEVKVWIFLAIIAACVPFVFRLTAQWRWDRLVGELSYPVYLIHLLVIYIYRDVFNGAEWRTEMPVLYFTAIVVTSVAIAALIYLIIERPVERLRRRRAAAADNKTLGDAVSVSG